MKGKGGKAYLSRLYSTNCRSPLSLRNRTVVQFFGLHSAGAVLIKRRVCLNHVFGCSRFVSFQEAALFCVSELQSNSGMAQPTLWFALAPRFPPGIRKNLIRRTRSLGSAR